MKNLLPHSYCQSEVFAEELFIFIMLFINVLFYGFD